MAAPPTSTAAKINIKYRKGDLFTGLQPGTLLLHACNTRGVWGSGIALEFQSRYRHAYKSYESYCDHHLDEPEKILGKTMLIAPDRSSAEPSASSPVIPWIACLFVRLSYGPPTAAEKAYGYEKGILENTSSAIRALLEGLEYGINKGNLAEGAITEIRMPKINCGRFKVDWKLTEEVLKIIEVPVGVRGLQTVVVYELDEVQQQKSKRHDSVLR